VEILERKLPLRIVEKSLREGSGGEGRWRGGPGQRVVVEVTNPDGLTATLLSQRVCYPPVGRRGGSDGALERVLLNGEPVQGDKPFRLRMHDVFTLELPGGGGWGPASERPADSVPPHHEYG
jgi:N-methylhydantoinase B